MTLRPPTGQRLPAEERREQILVCAIRLFEERPHTEVSTAEIAAAAGVARPLVHHYFGTRQQLYLEALRRLYFIAPVDPDDLPGETLAERITALLQEWLRGVRRHPNTWLAFTAVGGPGSDPEVTAILTESDNLVAHRLVDALDLEVEGAERARLVALVVAWSGMAKSAVRQWLAEQQLSEDDVRRLLVSTLSTILVELGVDVRPERARSARRSA